MKSTQKGNQYEKEVKDTLESQDWTVEGQHRKVMWLRDKYTGAMKMIMAGRDIYGCDLIAKKLGSKTKWIQVSTLSQKSAKQRQVLMFPWTLAHEEVELWLRIPGKKAFRVFRLEHDGGGQVFIEVETQIYKKRGQNAEEIEDGTGGTETKVAEEYPE